MKHYLLFYTPTDRNAKISSEQLWKYFPLQTKDCTSCYVSPEHLLGKPNVLWSCFFSLLIGSQGLQWLSKCCPRPRPSSRASWENTASPCICLATPASWDCLESPSSPTSTTDSPRSSWQAGTCSPSSSHGWVLLKHHEILPLFTCSYAKALQIHRFIPIYRYFNVPEVGFYVLTNTKTVLLQLLPIKFTKGILYT